MATDYDAPRVANSDVIADESLEELAVRRRTNDAATAVIDVDEAEEPFELPDAELTGDELTVRVLPKQSAEFTCSSCFLVQHRTRLARQVGGTTLCSDCPERQAGGRRCTVRSASAVRA